MAPVALVSTDAQHLDEQITSMMNSTENVITTGNQSVRVWSCNVCGKEGQRINIIYHIETHHITGLSLNCNLCGKTFRSRLSIRMHKKCQIALFSGRVVACEATKLSVQLHHSWKWKCVKMYFCCLVGLCCRETLNF